VVLVQPFALLLAVLGWAGVVVCIAAAAVLAVIAWRRPARPLTIVTVLLTALALLAAAIPASPAPAPVAALVTVAALVVAVAGGSPVARHLLDRVDFDQTEGEHGGLLADDGRELLRGGEVIGLLERLAVAGAIVAGFPEALAVVIAIKGVGRFTELETGAVRERFIVGTLVSWVWAAAAAGVVLLVRA
jgi:prepilin signal peptidase PulO-like enzyme (type II secretory pathway)